MIIDETHVNTKPSNEKLTNTLIIDKNCPSRLAKIKETYIKECTKWQLLGHTKIQYVLRWTGE